MLASGYWMLILFGPIVILFVCCHCYDEYNRLANLPPVESEEQQMARVWAQREALAATAEATLAARDEGALTRQAAAVAAAPVLLPLPYFPYAARPQGDKPSETVVCAICLESLRQGQLCSEVPSCRHVFHGDCLGEWARSNGSCPLCRAKIVLGSDEVAVADDMV